MIKLSLILFSAAILVAACGDNIKVTNDGGHQGSDGGGSNMPFPAAPAIGTQIDRLGRPAINTVLNHGFDPTAAAGTAQDAYNQDGSPGGWAAAYGAQFAGNLAILDALDTGLTCVQGVCTPTMTPPAIPDGAGCGNQVMYNGQLGGDAGGTATLASYSMLAGLLTDDELYLDTSKTVCNLAAHSNQNYLGVEFNVLSGGGVTNSCGGRDPLNDVIDTSYSALAVGLQGFSSNFDVAFGDGVGPHADVSDTTFPFLGAPH